MRKRTFKQNLSLFLVPFQLFSLTACGPKEEHKNEDNVDSSYHQTEEVVRVEYIIKEGDTLSELAARYKVDINELRNLNNINNNLIYVGNKIFLDVSRTIFNRYCDELTRVDIKNEILYNDVVDNELVVEYEVKTGDTLSEIANRFGVKEQQIQGYENASKIYVGQKLRITGVDNDLYESYNNGLNTIGVDNCSLEIHNVEKNSLIQDGYLKGIDISKHQGNIDWDVMQRNYENGIFDYIIIRIADNVIPGTTIKEFTVDSKFEEYLSECNKRGIRYGAYMFSRKTTVDGIREEAISTINYINNNLNTTKLLDDGTMLDLTFSPSLPLYFDCFEDNASAQRKILDRRDYETCVELIVEWCKLIEEAGFFPGVYYHLDAERQLGGMLDEVLIGEYNIPINRWVAYYGPRGFASQQREIEDIVFPDVHVTEMKGNIFSYQVEKHGIMPGISNVFFDVNITDEKLIDLVCEYYNAKRNNYQELSEFYVTSRGRI